MCRVDVGDVLGAVAYSLRAEVPLHVLISGSTYSALVNYVHLLEQVRSSLLNAYTPYHLKRT